MKNMSANITVINPDQHFPAGTVPVVSLPKRDASMVRGAVGRGSLHAYVRHASNGSLHRWINMHVSSSDMMEYLQRMAQRKVNGAKRREAAARRAESPAPAAPVQPDTTELLAKIANTLDTVVELLRHLDATWNPPKQP